MRDPKSFSLLIWLQRTDSEETKTANVIRGRVCQKWLCVRESCSGLRH